jgi:hypothetical protein
VLASPACAGDAADQFDQGLVRLAGLHGKTSDRVAEIAAVEGSVLVDLPGQESLAQRTEGNDADAQFFKHRHHLGLRLPPEQRVLALHGRDGLHRMGATDGLRAGFRKTEMPDLALLDEVLDRAGHVFDRHRWIDAVPVEQIDRVAAKPFERCFRDPLDVLGSAVQAIGALAVGVDPESELGRWRRASRKSMPSWRH